jgi:hypothetical protein
LEEIYLIAASRDSKVYVMLRVCQAEQQPIVGLHCLEGNPRGTNHINTSTNLGVCFHFERYEAKTPETKKLQVNSNI